MTLKNWNPNNLTQKNWSPNNWTPKNWSSNIWTPKNWSPRKLDSKKLEFVYLDSKKLESKKLSFWVWCFLVKTRIWKAGNACIVLRRLRRRPSKWNWVRRRPQSKVENLLKSVKKFSVVPPLLFPFVVLKFHPKYNILDTNTDYHANKLRCLYSYDLAH